jgi:hypothetical protein
MKQFKITHTHTSAHHALKRLTALALSVLLLLMPVQSVLAAGTDTDVPIGADKLEEKISESVLLYLGSNLARVRGTLAPIDIGRNGTAPFIHENRTMVPIRFLAESVGGMFPMMPKQARPPSPWRTTSPSAREIAPCGSTASPF